MNNPQTPPPYQALPILLPEYWLVFICKLVSTMVCADYLGDMAAYIIIITNERNVEENTLFSAIWTINRDKYIHPVQSTTSEEPFTEQTS